MKKLKIRFVSLAVLLLLIINSIIVTGIKNPLLNELNSNFLESNTNESFYFVHLTDTHIKHRIFDRNEISLKKLKTVVETILSFEKKPAFIVITGDLTEWGAGITGALNCIAFTECFYKKDNQLYADEEYLIPVYTTPGNHDYVLQRNLRNYYKYINENDRYTVTYEGVCLFFMNSGPNYYSDLSVLFQWRGQGLSNDDIEWLNTKLINCQSERKIILMHHPAVGDEKDLFIEYRQEFVELCETYEIEVVLAGHTHRSVIYDYELNKYTEELLNCSLLPPLYVQTADCKKRIHYRNITVDSGNILIEKTQEIKITAFDFLKNHPSNIGERQS